MKKRNLLFCGALLATLAGQAIESPYAGSVAGKGSFYLYQVETGTWLDDNMITDQGWTTKAQLDNLGFDIELRKPNDTFEGYQIYVFSGNTSELNGNDQDRFYLDQWNRDLTDWIFEPVTVDGVTNAYRIMAKAKEGSNDRSGIKEAFYIGADDNGMLSDKPTQSTWQLVTREERFNHMMKNVANGAVDCSWVLPGGNFGRVNNRHSRWNYSVANNYGGNVTLDGSIWYPAFEYWHEVRMSRSITFTDLPNGTYEFWVDGYYRDGEQDADGGQRFVDGTETPRVFYFAGGQRAPIMSIYAGGKDEPTNFYGHLNEVAGKYVPNSLGDAAMCFFNGGYSNAPLTVVVKNGKLVLGIEKTGGAFHDWFVHKRFHLRYVSSATDAEDLTAITAELTALIAEAETLPATPGFTKTVEAAKAMLAGIDSASSSDVLESVINLKTALAGVRDGANVINNYNATKAITDKAGINTASAQAKFEAAVSKADYEGALRELRYNRRRAVAVKQPDVFPGHVPAAGNYYLYNLGQQQFLCGGSDWGAHAALNLRGKDINLEDHEGAKPEDLTFDIETGLVNGVTGESGSHYLGYRGYMDSPKAGGWKFVPVEGKEGVYHIVQADYPDVHVAWNPYAGTDQGNNDETTVGTENRNLDPSDLNAQWKLVTAEERMALLEKASLESPVDATIYLSNPGFNQREDVETAWSMDGFQVAFRGANRPNFVAESYVGMDPSEAPLHDMSQMVVGLPAGVYVLSCNGYYRYGENIHQVETEQIQNAIMYVDLNEVKLPNILRESFKAPGEGENRSDSLNTVTYQIPNSPDQAGNYFKSNLYPVNLVFATDGSIDLPIGVTKYEVLHQGEWVVVDNFRLTAYGNNTTVDAVNGVVDGIENVIEIPVERAADNRIFNMQGIQVKNPTAPGIYIRNGRKFTVK